jgi:hypothetical protein
VYYCMKTFIAKLNIISKLVQKEQLKKWTLDYHSLFTLKKSSSE